MTVKANDSDFDGNRQSEVPRIKNKMNEDRVDEQHPITKVEGNHMIYFNKRRPSLLQNCEGTKSSREDPLLGDARLVK